jgi:hypothetical protein
LKRNSFAVWLQVLAGFAICAQPLNFGAQNSQDPLRSALAKRIDETKHGTGAVVGLLTPEGRTFAAYASLLPG